MHLDSAQAVPHAEQLAQNLGALEVDIDDELYSRLNTIFS